MSKTRKYASGNKKAGKGNGNSVINNTEGARNIVNETNATSTSNKSNGNVNN